MPTLVRLDALLPAVLLHSDNGGTDRPLILSRAVEADVAFDTHRSHSSHGSHQSHHSHHSSHR